MSEQGREATAGNRVDFVDSTPSSQTPPSAEAVSPRSRRPRGGEECCLARWAF
jgi:hypothetical protein